MLSSPTILAEEHDIPTRGMRGQQAQLSVDTIHQDGQGWHASSVHEHPTHIAHAQARTQLLNCPTADLTFHRPRLIARRVHLMLAGYYKHFRHQRRINIQSLAAYAERSESGASLLPSDLDFRRTVN